ncbi:vWA domain-containing protein [Halobaculum marinum]|uniref:VWA domain-containing protein n=1 Tax=Halobaculum marinum TaxID=3031996 RepID=A0ABD5WTX4_9EURY|nr:vWA domain-containing protein [Halobaculum sp. DT55]
MNSPPSDTDDRNRLSSGNESSGRVGLGRRTALKTAALGVGVLPFVRRGRAYRQPSYPYLDILSVDPTDCPSVLVNVAVNSDPGREGELDVDQFTIIEDGVEQSIEEFSFTSSSADIAFAFDNSGSMEDEIVRMQREVRGLTDAIEDAGIYARYGLVSFRERVRVESELTADAAAFDTAVDRLRPGGGGTSPRRENSFDGIARTLGLDFRPAAQKVVVVITDSLAHYGGDDTGVTDLTIDQVARRVRESGVAFIAVSPDQDDPSSSIRVLADRVDGLWIDIRGGSFTEILRRIRELVTTAYVLRYDTDAGAGESRDLTVTVADPQLGLERDSTTLDIPADADCGDDTGGDGTDRRRTVMITANGPIEYTMAVEGTVQPDRYGGDFAADDNDDPEEVDDGVFSYSNDTGPRPENAGPTNFRGDRFVFSGVVEEFDVDPRSSGTDYNVYLDDSNTTVERVRQFRDVEEHSLMITANGPVDYTVTVDGTLEPDRFGGIFVGDTLDLPVETSGGYLRVTDDTGPMADDADPFAFRGDRFLVDGLVRLLDVDAFDDDTVVKCYLDERLTPIDEIVSPLAGGDDPLEGYADGTGIEGDGSVLEILSTADNQFGYTAVVDGEAEKSAADGNAADDGDQVRSRGGVAVIKGTTGDEAGDVYEFTGELLSVTIVGVDNGFEIEVDDRRVTDVVLK